MAHENLAHDHIWNFNKIPTINILIVYIPFPMWSSHFLLQDRSILAYLFSISHLSLTMPSKSLHRLLASPIRLEVALKPLISQNEPPVSSYGMTS